MVTFDKLMSRADSGLLQKLLSVEAVRLLRALDDKSFSSSTLRQALLDLYPPHELLRRDAARRELLDLLRENEARQLVGALGLDDRRPFAALSELKVRSRGIAHRQLCDFFGVALPPVEIAELLPHTMDVAPAYGLFEHQRRAAAGVWNTLSDGSGRVLLHMPTGSGKTRTAMTIVARHLRAAGPTVVVWLASGAELCEQAVEEISRAWEALGDRSISVTRWWGSHEPDLSSLRDGVLVAGFAKVYSRAIEHPPILAQLGDAATLVVVDEAHQVVADSYQHVVDGLLARSVGGRVLGLSATPGRSWQDLDADEALAAFFHRQKVGLEIPGYRSPVDYLVDQGYLARPNFISIHHEAGPELSEAEAELLLTVLEIPLDLVERLARDERRNLLIAHEVIERCRQHARIIVFAATVEHAAFLATILRAKSIDARFVTSATPTGERRNTIDWYREPGTTPRVICNYGVLTAGFDAPRTSCAVIARPTKSLVLYSQMVGRAIRGVRAGGNAEADIVTVVDTQLSGFGSVAEAFTHWEDVWTAEEAPS